MFFYPNYLLSSHKSMQIIAISRPILTIFLLLVFCIHRSFAPDAIQGTFCSNTGSYAPNSSYEANLNVLLTSLAANATAQQTTTKFFNTSVDWHDDHGRSYTIFGLYLCRGDDVKLDCQTCVPAATRSILQGCPSRPVVATVWYVDCMVHYSNESTFRKVDYSQSLNKSYGNMTTNVKDFNTILGTLMSNLAFEVKDSTIRYGTKQEKINSWITVYSEAQCTPDLSRNDCYRCLTAANNIFPDCCSSSKSAQVLMPSCYARYDIKPFYALAPSPLSPPQSVPPPFSLPHSTPLPQAPPNVATYPTGKSKRRTSTLTIALVALVALLVIQVSMCIYLVWRRARTKSEDAELFHQNPNQVTHVSSFHQNESDFPNVESLQYDLAILQIATNYFSDDHKLGEGAFGGVFKGILPNGQEIAVKRLSMCSNQGAEQFMNEIVFIAKLQHRNLVRLLGFCLAKYEKLLVYEFVTNKSLDFILFDPSRREELSWPTRHKIISGIARGMLYLHEDSRLRIVHRDLKASNVLLDSDMNPKISDFGTARHFNVDESQANTSRIAGTFGYMAPEYILHGEFSLKSDVYSFGVLILEIVSGRKSTSFRQSRMGEHLLTYAWKHWAEGNPLEVVDPILGNSYSRNEVIRCIQLGLLCVQGDAEDRPTMSSIVISLNSDCELAMPQQPGLCISSKVESHVEVRDLVGRDESTSSLMRLSFSSGISST